MCVEALLKNAFRHTQVLVHSTRHKADRLVTGALELLFLALSMCLSPLSGRKRSACNFLAQKGRIAKGQTPRVTLRAITASLRGKGVTYIDAKHSS